MDVVVWWWSRKAHTDTHLPKSYTQVQGEGTAQSHLEFYEFYAFYAF